MSKTKRTKNSVHKKVNEEMVAPHQPYVEKEEQPQHPSY